MSLLVNILIGFLAYILTNYVLVRIGFGDGLSFIIAVIVGILVGMRNPADRFRH